MIRGDAAPRRRVRRGRGGRGRGGRAALALLVALGSMAVALAAPPRPARADEPAQPLEWRFDFAGPSVGVGAATDTVQETWTLGVHATLAHASGHGLSIVGDYSFSGWLVGIMRQALLLDLDYRYRLRLVGDDRFGLGLDLGIGPTAGRITGPSSTCFIGPCEPSVEARVSDGAHLGPNALVSLDFRAWGFLVGIVVRGRVLVALEPVADRTLVQQEFSASLYLGFGIY